MRSFRVFHKQLRRTGALTLASLHSRGQSHTLFSGPILVPLSCHSCSARYVRNEGTVDVSLEAKIIVLQHD